MGKAVTDVTTAQSTSVTIGKHTFSSLDGSTCNQFFTSSSYTTAKSKVEAAVKARTKYESEMKAFKKAHDDAIATQKKDQRKCQCTVRHDYNAAWTTATTHNANNLNAWNKAQHLICVHKGDLKIDGAGVTTGKCNVPACPQVKGNHFEEAMSEIEDLDIPEGYHTMPDGSLMAN